MRYKVLIICFVILVLLSGCLVKGQETRTLYYDDGSIKRFYKGTFKDGKLEGEGKMKIYYRGGDLRGSAEGIFKGGDLEGEGEIREYNREGKVMLVYKGIFRNSGGGKEENVNMGGLGEELEGLLKLEEMEGEMEQYYENGNIKSSYVGTFKQGLLEGKGDKRYYSESGKLERVERGVFR